MYMEWRDTVSERHYISRTLKEDIVRGVAWDTVSENQYLTHVNWKMILYMEWHVIEFQNVTIFHMYIEIEYC